MDTYVVNRDGSGLRKLSDEEARLAPPAFGDTSKDKRLTVYATRGDLFVYDNTTGKTRADHQDHRRRGQSPLPAGRQTHRVHPGENLYVMSLDGGSLVQMTDIRAAAARRPCAARGRRRAGIGRPGRHASTAAAAAGEPPKAPTARSTSRRSRRNCSKSSASAPPCARRKRRAARRKIRASRSPCRRAKTSPASQLSPDEKYVIATVIECRQRQEHRGPQLHHRVGLHRGHPGPVERRRHAVDKCGWRSSTRIPAK